MKYLFILLFSVVSFASFGQSLSLPYPYKNVHVPAGPSDYYLHDPATNAPWASTAAVLSTVTVSERFVGQLFQVGNPWVWYTFASAADKASGTLTAVATGGGSGSGWQTIGTTNLTGNTSIQGNSNDLDFTGVDALSLSTNSISANTVLFELSGTAATVPTTNSVATKDYVDTHSTAGITDLTGDVTASGTGSVAASVVKINGNTVPANSNGVLKNDGSGVLKWDPNQDFLGPIYSKSTWTTLTDFTVNGGATASVVSNKVQISGGVGTYTQNVDINYVTMVEHWKYVALISVDAVTGTSYGFGIGLNSINTFGPCSVLGRVGYYGATSSMNLDNNSGSTFANLVTGTPPAAVATDIIELTLERNGELITFTARNTTTNIAPVTFSYTYIPTSPYIHNTGKFSIYSFGGQFTVQSIKITSNELKNASLMVIGDSKSQGYNASLYSNRFSSFLNNDYKTIVHAGGFDRTTEVLAAMTEILALSPKQVLLCIGSNDPRSGISNGTFQSNYASISSQLISAGIDVYYALPFYETSQDLTPQKTYINSTYSAGKIIDTWTPMTLLGSLDADNVHPTNLGHQRLYNSILESFKLKLRDRTNQTSSSGSSTNPLTISDGSGSNALIGNNSNTAFLSANYNPISGTFSTTSKAGAYYKINGNISAGSHEWFISNANNTTPVKSLGLDENGVLTFANNTRSEVIFQGGSFTSIGTSALNIIGGGYYNGSGRVGTGSGSSEITFVGGTIQFVSNPTSTAGSGYSAAEIARFDVNGRLGIGLTSVNAYLHIKAGTATAGTAPLKLTSGTVNTTPEAGAIEFDGSHFYGTVGSTRYQFDQQQYTNSGVSSAFGRDLLDSDNGKIIYCTNSSAINMTIPTGLHAGFHCWIMQENTGIVAVSGNSGVTFGGKSSTATAYEMIEIFYYKSGDNYVGR